MELILDGTAKNSMVVIWLSPCCREITWHPLTSLTLRASCHVAGNSEAFMQWNITHCVIITTWAFWRDSSAVRSSHRLRECCSSIWAFWAASWLFFSALCPSLSWNNSSQNEKWTSDKKRTTPLSLRFYITLDTKWSFPRCSSQPIFWHSADETIRSLRKANNTRTKQSKLKQKNKMLNINKFTKTNLNLKPTLNFKNCLCVCMYIVYNCHTQHSTE